MMIVLDTNVVVSGILRPYGKPAALLRLVSAGKIQVAYDLRILSEYRDVLQRSKFDFSKEDVDAFLTQIEKEGLLVSATPLTLQLPDPDDQVFLEVAVSARASALVTGNKHHYTCKEYQGVKIFSPAEFLEKQTA
jgi:uncharacterized protein